MVEAIKQIEKTQTMCRILACAPSNSASDLLCEKILEHVDERKVYRMYASSWDAKRIPDKLKVSIKSLFIFRHLLTELKCFSLSGLLHSLSVGLTVHHLYYLSLAVVCRGV